MKKTTLIRTFIVSSGLILSSICLASSPSEVLNNIGRSLIFKPYIAADGQINKMRYSGEIIAFANIADKLEQINVGWGIQFHKYFSLEMGYENSSHKSKKYYLYDNDSYHLGVTDNLVGAGEENRTYELSVRSHGVHGNLIWQNIFWQRENSNLGLGLMANVGVNHMKVNADLTHSETEAVEIDDIIYRLRAGSKNILELGGGFLVKLTNNALVRGQITWQNKARINTLSDKVVNSVRTYKVPVRNSLKYGLGLVVFL